MAMPPKKRSNLDVVLPYRRSFITSDTLAQTVADVMAEFDKLEIATDELMGRVSDMLNRIEQLEKQRYNSQVTIDNSVKSTTGASEEAPSSHNEETP